MSGWDTSAVRSANLRLQIVDESGLVNGQQPELTHVDAHNQFRQFLREYRSEDTASYPYREELRANFNERAYFVSERTEQSARSMFASCVLMCSRLSSLCAGVSVVSVR
jgi:hypothetical protein